jgi:glycine dehydrogenase subunit 2
MSFKQVPQPQLIFEKGSPGRIGCNLPKTDTPEVNYKQCLGELREELILPEVSELECMRHFLNLSQLNYGIETGFYPLGSCTMKYNPRINEKIAALTGFTHIHPLQPLHTATGALEVIADLQDILAEITGFDEVTLQPLAGAHGELTCLMLIKAYHQSRGEDEQRRIVLVTDSAHGTNPATAALCGYRVRTIPTDAQGGADLQKLQALLTSEVAAVMLTNPSTLGLFETNIEQICEMSHRVGAQVFCDGANMNAMIGTTKPGDHGFDCIHLNLHKTFSTPHGGGGPGGGAIGVKSHLAPFLPTPHAKRNPQGQVEVHHNNPQSIGRVSPYFGQFLVAVRALAYLLAYGKENLARISKYSILNANYVMEKIKAVLPPAYDRPCMHECVLTAQPYKKFGIRALDISKRLIDYGFHPPTNYFPLIVPESLMIEPTETECKKTVDAFCEALIQICEEAKTEPHLLLEAPISQVVGRLDEALAVKNLDVRWKKTDNPSSHSD